MNNRRFPPPWSVEEYNDACFIVMDSNGQQFAYVYFEEEPGRRGGEDAHERRGAADCGELCEAARLAEGLNRLELR